MIPTSLVRQTNLERNQRSTNELFFTAVTQLSSRDLRETLSVSQAETEDSVSP
jgi:hypothetical protein